MTRIRPLGVSMLLALAAALAAVAPVAAQGAVPEAVRGVLFFSPTCAHCELVISEHLPPVFERFGGRPSVLYALAPDPRGGAAFGLSNGTLRLLLVDVSTEAGATLFAADSDRLGIAQPGVPRLDVGTQVLVGAVEIPALLPDIAEGGLASGGIPWPAVPGLEAVLAAIPGLDAEGAGPPPVDDGRATTQNPAVAGLVDRVARDPLANSMAIVVLLGLAASIVLVPFAVHAGVLRAVPARPIPLLALVGLAISVYLGSIEVSGSAAVCGPIGDCHAVQQSPYASILGVPVGIIGVLAYGTLLVAWMASRIASMNLARYLLVMVAGIALGGTLFSIYLTFLEPFVIGATCMWCITSAVTITALFWLSAGPGWAALRSGAVAGRQVPR